MSASDSTYITSNGLKLQLLGEDTGLVYDRSGNYFKRLLYKGYLLTPFTDLVKKIEDLQKLTVRPDDILIIAYPSCGTHWLWEIIMMLIKQSADYIADIKESLFFEMAALEDLQSSASPRVLNTHFIPEMLKPNLIDGSCKIVFITRNPKDVHVSNYSHRVASSLIPPKYNGSFVDHYELLQTWFGSHKFLTWMDYHLMWEKHFLEHPEIDILYLHYEDMKEDLRREVHRIKNHLSISASDALVDNIVEQCEFANMKKGKCDLKPEEKNMYRTGQVGKWKDYFTVAMNEEFDITYADEMKNSSIAKNIRFTL